MAKIDFVFTNPSHHHAMMAPVAAVLQSRGHTCRLISLAELRGFTSPEPDRIPVVRAIPFALRKTPNHGDALGSPTTKRRKLVQRLTWQIVLRPRLEHLLRHSDAIVIPNDAVFPYAQLVVRLRQRMIPFALIQEGIRFPLPNEHQVAVYGKAGARVVCCWGQAASEHFESVGAPRESLRVTGNPRYDAIDPSTWRARGDALLARLGLRERPLLFLSNPIDDQGYCSTKAKLDLFTSFARAAASAGLRVLAKLHPREDVAAFQRAGGDAIVLGSDEHLFAVLAAGRAAVVLASTVGLEALLFGLPLAVLAIPGHGHVFEYVARGAATALTAGDDLSDQLSRFASEPVRPQALALLDRHLGHRGEASTHVAIAIESVL